MVSQDISIESNGNREIEESSKGMCEGADQGQVEELVSRIRAGKIATMCIIPGTKWP